MSQIKRMNLKNHINKSRKMEQTVGKTVTKSSKPECFGILEEIFPMTEMGLRQTPDYCFNCCELKTKCLKYAMTTKESIQVEDEIIKRGVKSGTINFFERWSRKKQGYNKTNKQD